MIHDEIERARLAQQRHDKTHDVQLEITPGMFAPAEWASDDEIAERREADMNAQWHEWFAERID